jgi:hypothetical protein
MTEGILSLAGIEVSEEDMYRLMKDQTLNFVADLFVNIE